ncbi:MAG TPA: aldo/keto reductase family protein [Trueperaceae bacterium]|nr:aldo/keto reductase family protein [Trueperaceae bacterium]
MKYRRLGNTGLKVSEVSLGAWTTFGHTVEEQQTVTRIMEKAYELGINFFDNADVYHRGAGERTMGAALKELAFPRQSYVLSSKVFNKMSEAPTDRGLSRKHVLESIDMSLDRLGVDHLDIYFAHRYDDETSLEEIVEAFTDVVRSGRSHYWGTSMWPATRIVEAVAYAKGHGLVAPVTEQPAFSLLDRERVQERIAPVTEPKGIGLVVFSPLAQGMLTGKYDDGVPEGSRFANFETFKDHFMTEENVARVRALKPIADDLGITRAQLALAWILRQPGVSSVITGATRVDQVIDNAAASDVELDDATLGRIEEAVA